MQLNVLYHVNRRPKNLCKAASHMLYLVFYMHIYYTYLGHQKQYGWFLQANTCCQRCVLRRSINRLNCFSAQKTTYNSYPTISFFACQICAAARYSKDVLQWDDFGFCLDSLVGCWSLCCKVALSLLSLIVSGLCMFVCHSSNTHSDLLSGKFFTMDRKTK